MGKSNKIAVIILILGLLNTNIFSQVAADKYTAFSENLNSKTEDDKIKLCDEYIKNNSDDKKLAEVMYIKADSLFNQISKMRWSYKNLKKYDDIVKLLGEIVQKYPNDKKVVDAKYLVYQCYEKQANYEKSKIAFNAYIDFLVKYYGEKEGLLIVEGIGDKFCKDSDTKEALRIYLFLEPRLQKTNARYYYVRCKIAQCYEAENKVGCKKEILNEIVSRYEEISIQKAELRLKNVAIVNLTSLYFINYDKEERINRLKKLISLSDKESQSKIILYLGNAYLYDKNVREAKREYNELIEKFPEAPEVFAARIQLRDLNKKIEGEK